MLKITADHILLPDGKLHQGKTLVFDSEGRVSDILTSPPAEDVRILKGILTPGFINTHCHLELSYLKGAVPSQTGLPGFVSDLVGTRSNDESQAAGAAQKSDALMWESGIQGVGDICNRSHTITVKSLSRIRYYNFIETFGLDSRKAETMYRQATALCEAFEQHTLAASVTAHAAYSMSPLLLDLIRVNHSPDIPWTVHNQESREEKQLFNDKTGKFAELFSSLGIDLSSLPDGKGNSLQYLLRYVPSTGHLLFVHNTYTSRADIGIMRDLGLLERAWFALCPKANLYIENRLPDIAMLLEEGCRLTIGTDSLASNDELSIISELKAIHKMYPSIPAANLLTWATKNGADYFGWNDLGAFEKGNKPGCILIPAGGNAEDVLNWGNAVRVI